MDDQRIDMVLDEVLDRRPCPTWSDHVERGGGRGLRAAYDVEPDVLIEEIAASGLRGRGGGGFPTGTKWRTVAENASATAAPTVVVNGAEGEPGTFKDRTLLRTNPYKVLEGALIAARAIGADEVLVALKASFRRELGAVSRAILEMDADGVTAGVEVRIVPGPSAYLFGEETGLLEVVQGRQPFPRVSPPFRRGTDDAVAATGASADAELAVAGVGGAPPTLVNNVETLANVPAIVADGADHFRRRGTDDSPGTVLCTITGRTTRHGVGEVEMGTTLADVIDLVGGGPVPGRSFVGALSGAANPIVPADRFSTPLTYEDMERIGSGLGAAGFIVYDDRTDLVAAAHGVARFLAVESCGQCEPCKRDGLAISEHLDAIRRSNGTQRDLEKVSARLLTVADGARCYLAIQQQQVVGSMLELFGDQFADRLRADPDVVDVEPTAPIADIRRGRAVLDASQATKQPDWSHDERSSGSWPAALLGDTPVEVATPSIALGGSAQAAEEREEDEDPFGPLDAVHAEVEGLLDDLPHHPCPQRDDAMDRLAAAIRSYHDLTERILYPIARRKLPARDDDPGTEAIGLAEVDRQASEELLGQMRSASQADHRGRLTELTERVRQEIALDREVLVPQLGVTLADEDLHDLGLALEEARLASSAR